MPADLDVVTYLTTKGYQGKQAKGTEVVYPCFFCGEEPSSKKRKLYINTEDGWYHCKVCGNAGGTYLLQRHFGDDPKEQETTYSPMKRRQVLSAAAEVGMQMLANNDEILLDLMSDRGLSPETIIHFQLGLAARGWSLSRSIPSDYSKDDVLNSSLVYRDGPRKGEDFFYNHLLIPYVSRGSVVQMRGRALGETKGGKYLTPPDDPVMMFNVDDLDDADDAIIVEGEFDAMVVKQHLLLSSDDKVRKIAVVGLAGANGFLDGFEGYFSECRRVYVALDPDDTGKREAIKIKEKLGTKARIVELPAELPKCDWTEFLLPVPADADEAWHAKHPHAGHTWRDIVGLLGNAAGKRLFTMAESGYAYRTQRHDVEGIKTGFQQLDATILPGITPGQVMVVLAKTGTGKTLFLCNLAYYMRQHKILFITLEMTKEEIYERLMKIYLFHRPRATPEEIEFALANVVVCDENRLTEKDVEELLDEFEIEMGAKPEVCFIDYLGYFARGVKGNGQYEKATNAVMALKAIAKRKRGPLAVISPAQVNRLAKEGKPIDIDDARDSGAIEETADFLLSIWRPDEALVAEAHGTQAPSGKLAMQILKSRHGGKGRRFNLVMDLLTLAIVDEGTNEAKRASQHNHLAWRGETWADLRRQDTQPIQDTLKGMR